MRQQLIEAILDLRPEDQSVEELLPTLEDKTDEELLKDLVTSAKWYKESLYCIDEGIRLAPIKLTPKILSHGRIPTSPDAVRWGYEPEKPQSNEE